MGSLRWFLLLTIFTTGKAAGQAADTPPLVRAHAHNDYEHPRPLLDALACGFGSIEADVHLVDGRLLVVHDRKAVKPERTLEALYLDPLRERVKQNGGRVYRSGPTIILLIDVKSEAVATYEALHAVLKNYVAMLTVFRDGVTTPGAITVIVSGSRAPAVMAARRFATLRWTDASTISRARRLPRSFPWSVITGRKFSRGAGPAQSRRTRPTN